MVKLQPSKFCGKPKEIVLDLKFCKQYGTKAAVQEFSLGLDQEIVYNYNATVISYVASITTDTAQVDPATIIPEKSQQYCKVLGKELADELPDHK
jgi:short-subunit dehydrogenase